VIDCGPTQSIAENDDQDRSIIEPGDRKWRTRLKSFPAPEYSAGIGPQTSSKDWRFGRINVESFDFLGDQQEDIYAGDTMSGTSKEPLQAAPAASLGPNLGGPGQATKARYLPLDTKNTEIGWGIVHLYREGNEAPEAPTSKSPATSSNEASSSRASENTEGEEGTILCIPSVPIYLSPEDFLGFVGEKWMGDVSHYRMVMTSRMNRYMVLMKFRDNKQARDWRKEFDGKVFNSMVRETLHSRHPFFLEQNSC